MSTASADGQEDCINEQLIKSHADILSLPEWRSLGYDYINIECASLVHCLLLTSSAHM